MKKTILTAFICLLGFSPLIPIQAQNAPSDQRPALQDRKFTSKAVEDIIREVSKAIQDPKLREMFRNCYPNTLDTTVKFQIRNGKPDTFVITGDINAMWLRDSSAQVWPYLQLLAADKELQQLIAGLINRQTACIRSGCCPSPQTVADRGRSHSGRSCSLPHAGCGQAADCRACRQASGRWHRSCRADTPRCRFCISHGHSSHRQDTGMPLFPLPAV